MSVKKIAYRTYCLLYGIRRIHMSFSAQHFKYRVRESLNRTARIVHFCSSTGGTISAYFLSNSGVLV